MTNPQDSRSITVTMSETVFTKLVEKARRAGMTPTLYGRFLFEAAWAARCGKAENDPILCDAVEKSFSRRTGAAAPLPSGPQKNARPKAIPVPVILPVAIPVPVAVPVEPPPAPAAVVEEVAGPVPPPVDPAPEETIDVAGMVRNVRALAAAGNSPKEIAKQIGRPLPLVREIIQGRIG